MLIYVITNTVNGKQYVGQHSGTNLRSYWLHCARRALRNERKSANRAIENAVRKYGLDAFKADVIEDKIETKADLDRLEKFWIETMGTLKPGGYNLTKGGEGILGFKLSESTIKAIAEKRRGQKWTEEQKLSLRGENWVRIHGHCPPRLGQKASEAERIKHSQASKRFWDQVRKGLVSPPSKERTEEYRNSVSARMRGNKFSLGRIHKAESLKKQSETLRRMRAEQPERWGFSDSDLERMSQSAKSAWSKMKAERSEFLADRNRRVSEGLKRAYAEGRRKPNGPRKVAL